MVTSRSQSRRVDDRYDLLEPLGRGGMGVVWLAQDTVLQRKVAVKQVEFPPGVPAEEIDSLRERVLREARSAGRLNHPNVTTIFDVVRDEGTTWIVMEYVDAPTLTDLVSQEGALSPSAAAEVGLGVLSALEAAHAAGIIHRDVKPANVMVAANGNVKLADFGVAAVQGDPKLTMTGFIIGSPSFMAPEQAQEGVSTAASDMWGLGATLYYAVEGEAPFDRGAAIPTLAAVTYEPPRPLQRAGALAPIIERLLAKQPEDRPSGGELEAVLREIIAGDGAAVPARPVVYAEEDDWAAGEHVDDGRRSSWPWVVVAALLLLGAVLLLPRLLDPQTAPQDEVAQDRSAETDDQAQEPAAPAEDGQDAGQAVDPQEPAQDDPADDGTVPEDWSSYEVADTGTSVAHPSDWFAEPRSETATDLNDPEGGRYLRVDYTEDPGEDAAAAWESLSEDFGAEHDDYTEIAIEPYDYPGAETAALWEYTYSEGGTQLHAYNLAIVIGGRGYALNFQTRENQWDESLQLWEQFVAGFEPAS